MATLCALYQPQEAAHMESGSPSDVPFMEMEGYLVTGSTLASMIGKGRTKGKARLDPRNLTYYDMQGGVVLSQPLSGITATELKRMTGAVIVKGDTAFKVYPLMEASGSDMGDVANAAVGVAQAHLFHSTLNDFISMRSWE
jgi:hypothetical protein